MTVIYSLFAFIGGIRIANITARHQYHILRAARSSRSSTPMSTQVDPERFAALYRGSLIPLHACLVGLVWIVHDYLITLEDEIRYIWTQKWGFGKIMFFWIRYYSLALLMFDVTQIHVFSIPGITNDNVCVAMDSIIRVVGAISLWSVEIVLQLRIYALYKCSKKVAWFNGILFVASIGGFLYVLIYNAMRRREVIANVIHLPLPGCPSVHSGIEYAQWIPATAFEGVLFFFAVARTLTDAWSQRDRKSVQMGGLYELLIRDNIVYFFGIACLLIFNNLMVVGATKIPWFSYSPFHAAVGVATTRMLLNLRKAAVTTEVYSRGRVNYRTNPTILTASNEDATSFWQVNPTISYTQTQTMSLADVHANTYPMTDAKPSGNYRSYKRDVEIGSRSGFL